ncbi:MAG: PEP-CTERM-box response regulator transcription factor [bacterium]
MEIEKNKILIVEDEEAIREQFQWHLREDYDVLLAATAEEGLKLVKLERPDLVVLDLTLSPNGKAQDGFQLFEDIQTINHKTKVIVVTGNDNKELALKAVQMGAYDFYQKPVVLDEFRIILKRALHLRRLETELEKVRVNDDEESFNHEIIGQSARMLEVYDTIERTSKTDATILLTGESGTGKELVAKAIHLQSLRKQFPFVVINCGAIPDNLLESELFGHEKGAFTGAHMRRKGRFELANKGTIFLDEIGELSPALQVKLLRFLQEWEIERVGGSGPIELDVRIIAATNRNLEEEIAKGSFRQDLYYRLSVISIHMPPLRDRGDDIVLLANHFLSQFNQDYKRDIRGFASQSIQLIKEYAWPGNIRELQNKIKRAVIMAKQPQIMPEDLKLGFTNRSHRRAFRMVVQEFEEKFIREALLRNCGNVSRTAKELEINRTTFYDLLHKYQIDHAQYVLKNKKIKSEISKR